MSTNISTMMLSMTAISLVAAVSMAQERAAPKQEPSKITTLSGCVSPTANAKSFTLEDGEQGQTFRLTGTDVREYVGKHVELLGAPGKRLVIVGGLYPNANVAAQGGIDSNKAAIAAQSGPTSNAQRPLVEFKVRSVRLTPGNCAKE